MVVVDKRVLAAVDLDAVGGKRHHLAGAPPGVAQDHVRGAEHRGRVGDRPHPAVGMGGFEQVELGVELGDHRLGDGLADLVLVRLLGDDPL